MAAFVEHVGRSGGRALWIDCIDYAARLLAGGDTPWLDTAVCAAWLRSAQRLLASDVMGVPVERVCAAWLESHPALHDAMGAKSRVLHPLKTLLVDESLRAHLLDLVGAIRGTLPGTVLAFTCPSPRAWVSEACRQASGSPVEVGDDEADSAAAYVANFLRVFADAGVDALLLVETADSEPRTPADVAVYDAVLNTAAHYRWDVGLAVPGGRYVGGDARLDFVVAPGSLPGAMAGIVMPAEFWAGASVPEPVAGGFHYGVIPAHAAPEQVLERLAVLRSTYGR